jgi:hypothetical protein
MKLTFLSQRESVDEWNRMRLLCGQAAQQFELDDGTIYPTI